MAWDLRDLTAEKFWQMESKPLSYQRIILSALDSAETANLLSESPSTRRRIQSASGQYAAVAFTTLPTSREFVLSNSEISCAVKIRLGLSQFSDARSWCNCSPDDCNHPSHFDSCVASAGLRTMRHDAVTAVQALYWQQAGCTLRRELRHIGDRKRTDLEIFTGTKTYQTDTAITDVGAHSADGTQIQNYEKSKLKNIKMPLFKLAESSILLSYLLRVSLDLTQRKLLISFAQLQLTFVISPTLRNFCLRRKLSVTLLLRSKCRIIILFQE